jgi:serine/threonine-protein kinase HipA
MTSNGDKEAFVWIWLPGETVPIVAGRLEMDNSNIHFNYGKSYLERGRDTHPPIPIYEPELPLRAGALSLPDGLTMPGCIRDASPDAWGRRVIINKKLGLKSPETDTTVLVACLMA